MGSRWQQMSITGVAAVLAVLITVSAEDRQISDGQQRDPHLLDAAASIDHLRQGRLKNQPVIPRSVIQSDRTQNSVEIPQDEDSNKKENNRKRKKKLKAKNRNSPRKNLPPFIRRVVPLVAKPVKVAVARAKSQKTQCGQSYDVNYKEKYRIHISDTKPCSIIFRAAAGVSLKISCAKISVGDCADAELFLSDGNALENRYCGDPAVTKVKVKSITQLLVSYKTSQSPPAKAASPDVTCILKGRKGDGYNARGTQLCPLICGRTIASAEAEVKPLSSNVAANLTSIPPPTPSPNNVSVEAKGASISRVQGGKNASIGEWPWIVYIKRTTAGLCGGMIVSKNFILTAAHCVYDVKTSNVKVIANEHDVTNTKETETQMVRVSKMILHPKYNSATLKADIALLKLKKPLKFGPGVGPICLAPEGFYEGSKVVTLGWGSKIFDGEDSEILQEATLKVDNTLECAKNHSILPPGPDNFPITNDHVCASAPGIDSCLGDSGGPLITQLGTTWYQLGIVSFGHKCAIPNFPGVYTKVSSYASWIHRKIRKDTCD